LLQDLNSAIAQFVGQVLQWLDPQSKSRMPASMWNQTQQDLAWLEVTRWAHEIARFLPGFPNEDGIGGHGTLANTVTSVIWNASAVHSLDHGALHTLMNDPTKPMPFVMRVPFDGGDMKMSDALAALGPHGDALKDKTLLPLSALLVQPLKFLTKAIAAKYPLLPTQSPDDLLARFQNLTIPSTMVPLASPADVLFGKMADLLFFQPHNSTLLYDCDYAFLGPDLFPERYQFAQATQNLHQFRDGFQQELDAFEAGTWPDNAPAEEKALRAKLGIPHVRPPADKPSGFATWTDADKRAYGVGNCIAAGIQY
jgi:hypothetical protein